MQECKHYCPKCGEKTVFVKKVKAEKVKLHRHGSYHTDTWSYAAFDRDSGKRRLMDKYQCPNNKWYDPHDEHVHGPYFMDDDEE
jgi:predicted RNA-binding Zn-ribbon protein involved in translation (DUF1610 family)